MPSNLDRAIARLARAQHGVFSRDDAVRLGATKAAISARIRSGRWERLARGVFVLAGADRGFLTRAMAASLLTPGGSVSGSSGAALHRLSGFAPCRVELTVRPPASTRNPLATIRRRTLPYRSTRVQRIPVGTIDQIIADLCAMPVGVSKIVAATDDALLERRVHISRLEDQLVVFSTARAPGAARLRSIVTERSAGEPVPQSELERLACKLVSQPGVPSVLRQFKVPWRVDGHSAYVDFLIKRWGVIIEVDGRRWHTRVADFERDRKRDRAAMARGLVVVRFTWSDLTFGFQDALGELLAIGAMREQEPRPGRGDVG